VKAISLLFGLLDAGAAAIDSSCINQVQEFYSLAAATNGLVKESPECR